MGRAEADSDELLDNASHGDEQAKHALFARHRARLKRMVALRSIAGWRPVSILRTWCKRST